MHDETNHHHAENHKHSRELGHRAKCGAKSLSHEQQTLVKKTASDYKNRKRFSRQMAKSYQFDVYWHIIQHTDGRGVVSDKQIEISMNLLNQGFSGNLINANEDCFGNKVNGIDTSIQFVLKGIDRTVNDDWFTVSSESDLTPIAESLHKGNCSTMNVYTSEITDAGGFANVPITCFDHGITEDPVFLGYDELPSSLDAEEAQYGDLLIHEAGHWVGLEHPFEGGCSESNDNIVDTPPQLMVDDECPIGSDTCAGGGIDSIHNYMAYTGDCCVYRFTPDQITYAHAQLDAYRVKSNDNPQPVVDDDDNNDETGDDNIICVKKIAKKIFAA